MPTGEAGHRGPQYVAQIVSLQIDAAETDQENN